MTRAVLGRIQMIDRMMMAFAGISLVLSIIEYEYEYDYQDGDTVNIQRITKMLVLITCINFMMVCINILRTYLHHKFLAMKRLADDSIMLQNTGDWINLVLENLAIFCGPNILFIGRKLPLQGVVFGVEVYYMQNDILNIIQLYKTWIIFRCILTNSDYASNRAYRVCKMYGNKTDIKWVAKSYMRKRPLFFVLIIFFLGILIFAQVVRIAESPLSRKVSFES